MLGGLLSWFSSHLSLWPSLGLVVAGLFWVMALITLDEDTDSEGSKFIFAIGVLGMIAWLMACFTGEAPWVYWIPYLAGVAIIPALFGVATGWDGVKASVTQWKAEAAAERGAQAAEKARKAEAAQKAKAAWQKSPDGIVARCENIVREYIAALPQDLTVIESRREAETKLEALRALFGLLARLEKLNGIASFEDNLRYADGVFSDVSLEAECGALVKSLRERSVTDIAAEIGEPVLPDLREELPVEPLLPRAKRQTA